MRDVAIIGAGELGGMIAHVLARRNTVVTIRLIDDGGVAEGKALDITQAAPLEGFATEVVGSSDLFGAAGADFVVIADRAGGTEYYGSAGLTLIRRVSGFVSQAVLVCAGASQRELVELAVREGYQPRARMIGSAPEALAAAARSIVALEVNASPRDVTLSILGVPPANIVIGWEAATVGGFAATRVLSEPVRRRVSERIMRLWPVGPYALASAAAKAIGRMSGRSRGWTTCFIAPDDSMGARVRAAALPVRLGSTGIVEVLAPALSSAEQVALDNAMLL